MNNVIAAISTPIAISSVSVIRMSGEGSFIIIDKLFKPFKGRDILNAKGYTSAYGHIMDSDEIIDEVVVHFFRNPYSYTGEDIVEISCHGGIYIVKKVLALLVEAGAILAKAGEFTMRAVLNGKMTLTQAEGVIDLINAREKQSARIAMETRNGILFKNITEIKEKILKTLSKLAAFIDYPEEEIEEIEMQELEGILYDIVDKMQSIVDTYDYGSIIKNGVDTVIIGKTNVGKSSIMNMLSRAKKSIVTEIEGTTRDIIENTIQLQNVILNLNDTAGIRDTDDIVENIGAELSFEKLKTSLLVLAVFDASRDLDNNDKKIMAEISTDIKIAVINKIDKAKKIDMDIINSYFNNVIFISAISGEGLIQLEQKIEEILKIHHIDTSMGIISNERQKHSADSALMNMKNALHTVKIRMTLDAIVLDLEQSIEDLMKLTGDNINEEIVNAVFSNFCVGK